MSTTAMPIFNTLKSVDEMKAAGVPEPHARATVQVVAEALELNMDRFATRDDLKLLASELRGEIKPLAVELRLHRWALSLLIGISATILWRVFTLH